MITQEQADNATEFHDTTIRACEDQRQPRRSNVWRRNGKTKRWKRQPERFRIPVKHGLYSYGYIDSENPVHMTVMHAGPHD